MGRRVVYLILSVFLCLNNCSRLYSKSTQQYQAISDAFYYKRNLDSALFYGEKAEKTIETGLGKIADYEGIFGLQRAFKMAGANKLLLTLWEVPSNETAELMRIFYDTWLKGSTPEDALIAAQKEMRKKYSPYFWAGFVLVR